MTYDDDDSDGLAETQMFAWAGHAPTACRKYMGDNDGTSPQLTCIRKFGHEGPCDNVRGDEEAP